MKPVSSKERISRNKKHWDTMALRDWPMKADLRKQIRDGLPYLEQMEPRLSAHLGDVTGKQTIVLQFGDALVLLALAKKGALATGVDFSGEQVRLAKESADYCGVHLRLVQADCQNLPESIPSNHFELAVAECGIFIWIENLDAWMRNAYRVLRKGGKLVVSDFHPLSICTTGWREGEAVTFTRSYFDQQPQVCQEENVPPSVEFFWKLSDVIDAAIQAGFNINHVEEFCVEEKVKGTPLIPTDFLLVATKT